MLAQLGTESHCSQWSHGLGEHFLGALVPRHARPCPGAGAPLLALRFLPSWAEKIAPLAVGCSSVFLVPLPLMADTCPHLLSFFLGDFYPGLKTRGIWFSCCCNKELSSVSFRFSGFCGLVPLRSYKTASYLRFRGFQRPQSCAGFLF